MAYGDGRVAVATDGFGSQTYGVDRHEIASDAFPSSIDGNWTVGEGFWFDFSWVSSGIIVSDFAVAAGMHRSGETYADDQYSILTFDSESGGAVLDYGASVRRGSGGSDESGYHMAFDADAGNWALFETTASRNFSELASTTHDGALSQGDTITCEVEGTSIRGGTNEGSGDTERITTTDATLTSGDPGIYSQMGFASSVKWSAWSGGDIGGLSNDTAEGWRNGHDEWFPFADVAGGFINPEADSTHAGAIRTIDTYSSNQYSTVTLDSLSTTNDRVGAMVRCAVSISNTSCYLGVYRTDTDDYELFDVAVDGTFTSIASTPNGGTALVAGDTLTIETEGTTVRMGTDEGSGDAQRLNTTDVTWTEGRPGVYAFQTNDLLIDSWSGGSLVPPEVAIGAGLTRAISIDGTTGTSAALSEVSGKTLVVIVVMEDIDPGVAVTTVTYDGTNESLSTGDIARFEPAHGRVAIEVWYLDNPIHDAAAVTVNFDGLGNQAGVYCFTVTNTAILKGIDTDEADPGTSLSVSPNQAVGDLSIAVYFTREKELISTDTGTEIADFEAANSFRMAVSWIDGTGTIALDSSSATSVELAMLGFVAELAGGGGGTPIELFRRRIEE